MPLEGDDRRVHFKGAAHLASLHRLVFDHDGVLRGQERAVVFLRLRAEEASVAPKPIWPGWVDPSAMRSGQNLLKWLDVAWCTRRVLTLAMLPAIAV